MGSIVSAITGSGSKKAANAQIEATQQAIGTQQEFYAKALDLQQQGLDLQENMFNQSLARAQPYIDAGTQALSVYESMLYGVPIEQTQTYKTTVAQNSYSDAMAAYKSPKDLLPENIEKAPPNPYGIDYQAVPHNGDYFKIEGDKVYRAQGTSYSFDALMAAGESLPWEEYGDAGPKPEMPASQNPTDVFASQGTLDGSGGSMDPRMANLIKTPGYQFRKDEGASALESYAGSKSSLLSGGTLKAMERYGQDYATNEYSNFMSRVGALASQGAQVVSGVGNQSIQSGANQAGTLSNMANLTSQTGQGIAAGQSQIGAARASGYLGEQAQGSALLNMGAQIAGFAFSDIRLKEDVEYVGEENGFNIYEFNYKGDPQRYVGVIADEVEGIMPDSVHDIHGYKAVDYAKIGVKFRRAE